jgi:hypothetical protein
MSLRDLIGLIGRHLVSIVLRRPGDILASWGSYVGLRPEFVQQSGMLILTDVEAGKEEALHKTLEDIRSDLIKNKNLQNISFYNTTTLHYAAWMILPGIKKDGKPSGPARLAFETNYDGCIEKHLMDLVANCRQELDAIYAFFPDYPLPGSPPSAVHKFLSDKCELTNEEVDTFAYYVALPGRPLKDIKNAIAVYYEAKRFIDDPANASSDPRTALIKHFEAAVDGRPRPERFSITQKGLRRLFRVNMAVLTLFYLVLPIVLMILGSLWWEGLKGLKDRPDAHTLVGRHHTLVERYHDLVERYHDAIVVLTLQCPLVGRHHIAIAFLTLLCLLPLLYMIRWGMIDLIARHFEWREEYRERRQPLFDPTGRPKPDYAHLDLGRQNHLCSYTTVKPGRFRMYVIKRALWLGVVLSNYFFILGKLDQISTIHFARWTLIGDQLIFYGSYDGSWSSYLSDFSDEAWGVNLVWGNTIRFPQTRFITGRGARDLEGFQRQAMEHYAPAPVFYSAYRNHSLVNILRYLEFRDKLLEEMASSPTTGPVPSKA